MNIQQPAPTPASIRTAGVLFLLAIITYATGNGIVAAAYDAAHSTEELITNRMQLTSGVMLMLLNSLAVAGIGSIFLPVFQRYNPVWAAIYFGSRWMEAILLAIGAAFLFLPLVTGSQTEDWTWIKTVATKSNFVLYQIAMMVLGTSGMIFCYSLFRISVLPRWFVMWGIAGYAGLLIGSILELYGFPVGVICAIPGGLFELMLGIWLIWKGSSIMHHR